MSDPQIEIRNALIKSSLIAGMSEAQLETLIGQLHYQPISLAKDEVFATSKQTISDLLLITKGTLRAEMMGESGKKELLMDRLTEGRIVAPGIIFSSKQQLPVTIVAQEDSSLIRVPRSEFVSMLEKYPIIMQNFLRMVSDICFLLTQRVGQLSLTSLQGKLARLLLRRCREEGTLVVQFQQTWKDVAQSFGVSRQSLARSMGELADQGLIEVDGKQVTVLDKAGLQSVE